MTSNVSRWRWWWLRPQFRDEPQNLLEHLPCDGDLGHLEDDIAAVATAPAPPESFFGSLETSMTLIGWPLARSTARGCARREVLPGDTQNAVSRIFSGLNTRSSRRSARRLPDAASTTRPSRSTAILYSCPADARAAPWRAARPPQPK